MRKKLILLFLTAYSLTAIAQDNRFLIKGKVLDSVKTVANAHIINLKNNLGTFSSDNGNFQIYVTLGDTLSISSVQHITKNISVNQQIITDKKIIIKLKLNTYVLDEFDLRRNELLGRLGIDIKDVPVDKRDSILKANLDFSKVDIENGNYKTDAVDRAKPPIVNTMQGAMPMAGGGVGVGIPFKDSERLWALRRELERKKQFPYEIMSELGEKFFFVDLKIPVDKYYHFLEYCNPLGIEELHRKNKTLEIIKILKEESVEYLQIIKKE
ncbi:hypothetical protein DUT90_06475 [Polaribacter sp. WD7]|uniref:hypothetical protein n=1 Tax=Polaribacter sp. WD7 TaxID=2269061 RepID=UPI000DF42C6E|nr:hypothetical protein [Polaribacter sp. WD7]RCS26768.1 hypothetical protein DUT90_06475 [Polaribacter sp. WD7]